PGGTNQDATPRIVVGDLFLPGLHEPLLTIKQADKIPVNAERRFGINGILRVEVADVHVGICPNGRVSRVSSHVFSFNSGCERSTPRHYHDSAGRYEGARIGIMVRDSAGEDDDGRYQVAVMHLQLSLFLLYPTFSYGRRVSPCCDCD